ncbi:MAG: hypothetical protein ACYTG1_01845 [Planctomycetota bacterium]|jgi:YVTN family beta-propeller protein
MRHAAGLPAVVVAAALVAGPAAGQSFVNWESPHVSPLALTPDGARLLAVNTADNRLEVFTVDGAGLVHVGAVPVGLDPVSVRARTNDEAWVVNHVSDSISVVDVAAMRVIATIGTGDPGDGLDDLGDEPADVVFAGAPERAFVSVSQLNQVKVYDPADLSAPTHVLDLDGEDPRALATDGTKVFVAIFESGNDTTILEQPLVSSELNPYPGHQNPPPIDGAAFNPLIAPVVPPPAVSLIVKKDGAGDWMDDNGGNWSTAVTWDLFGHDVAVIDASSPTNVSYVDGLMNANMHLTVTPGGDVLVVGTDCINEIRFEPNVQGIFVRVTGASFPAGGGAASIADLNAGHLDYSTPSVPAGTRAQSVGDPRGVAWSGGQNRAYVTGMGSNNLVAVDAGFSRLARLDVGEGPTGVVVDAAHQRIYVLNKFEATISVIDEPSFTELHRVPLFDPTPPVIRAGRPFLYDTHLTSGLGQASCGSCHIDGRMDQVSWDLGDPSGAMKTFNQVCNGGIGGCEDWHPMKGPMATQTLVGIIGTEPFHWRADREDFPAFNGAFVSLLGRDTELAEPEMTAFTSFVATLTYPPQPNRLLDGGLRTSLPNGGNPVAGESLYMTGNLDGVNCVTCHALDSGTNGQLTSAPLLQQTQSMKIPQLRNMYEKTGFDLPNGTNRRGFGYTHDGAFHTLFEFLQFPGFQFQNDQQRLDVEAFLLSFGVDTHAGVGAQATVGGTGPDQTALRDQLVAVAAAGQVGLVVKGSDGGEARGFHFVSGNRFRADRPGEFWTTPELDAAADASNAFTYTLVPLGSELRIGIDRDEDGFLDREELDACADPADGQSFPGNIPCPEDATGGVAGAGDDQVDVSDLLLVLAEWGQGAGAKADVDCSGTVDVSDLLAVLAAWGPC